MRPELFTMSSAGEIMLSARWAAENYGGVGQVSHADRYARGEEFMEVVKALWDSWGPDAVIDDRAAGIYARRDRIRSINHRGYFYTVAGPLNLPRCPQGEPTTLASIGGAFTLAVEYEDAVSPDSEWICASAQVHMTFADGSALQDGSGLTISP